MNKKARLLTSLTILTFGIFLSGCEIGKNDQSSASVETVSERPGVTIKGKLTAGGGKFFVGDGSKTTEVISKKVDLNSKIGMSVEVYGEFSGTTLYVDELR